MYGLSLSLSLSLSFTHTHTVDNCYGEFVEDLEPTHVGADLVAGR